MIGIDDVAIGLGAGLLPSMLDSITGASAKRRKALDQQDYQMQSILNEIEQEMGTGAADTGQFNIGKGLLDKGLKQQQDKDAQDTVASGGSSETAMTKLSARDEAYNSSTMKLLSAAMQERQQLKALKRRFQLERAGMQVSKADQDWQQMQKLSGGLMSALPYMIGGGGNKKTAMGLL